MSKQSKHLIADTAAGAGFLPAPAAPQMKTYKTEGMRPIRAESAADAAKLFADRLARREYGKKGYGRPIRLDGHAADGSWSAYEAFIGYTPAGEHNSSATVGRNVWFSVFAG